MDFLDQLEKSYQPVKLKPYQLKKTFPVKKILAEKEKYYKKRLNRILEIERELTNKIFDTPDPLQKETWRCIRDGLVPRVRIWTFIRLDQIKKLIRYYN